MRTNIKHHWKRWTLLLLFLSGAGLATTNNVHIWPIRNVLIDRAATWWEQHIDAGTPRGVALLAGCVRDPDQRPIAGATVLASEPDGTLHQASTATDGCFAVPDLPEGRYVPSISAIGFDDAIVQPWGVSLTLHAGDQQHIKVMLARATGATLTPVTDLHISPPITASTDLPQPTQALRRQISYSSDGQANQLTYLYTPVTATTPLATLFAVYPGPADQWEGVSVPLAAAGYAVVAIGPPYSFAFEHDVAEIQRLVQLIRAGALPQVDGSRIVLLGGSYSSLHVWRVLRDDVGFQGVVLLGPISDLFDLRLRYEQGTFAPPFGLDQALIALGRPNTAIEHYAPYSALFHLRPDLPPLLLMHSRDDEIVPFEQTEWLAQELDQRAVPYEAHFFAGMSHYLRTNVPSEDLDRLYAITLDFLARQLKRN